MPTFRNYQQSEFLTIRAEQTTATHVHPSHVHASITRTCIHHTYMHSSHVHAFITRTCIHHTYMHLSHIHAFTTRTCIHHTYMHPSHVHASITCTCIHSTYKRQEATKTPVSSILSKGHLALRAHVFRMPGGLSLTWAKPLFWVNASVICSRVGGRIKEL